MQLILCAGEKQRQGWTNHDVRRLEGIDIVCDLKLIKAHVPDNSCTDIEITHALEHFPTKEVPEVLSIIYDLLQDNGKLYVEVPNFAWHAQLLTEYRDDDAIYYAFGGQLDEYDFHKTGFTPEILERRLKEAGFKDIKISGHDSLKALCIKSQSLAQQSDLEVLSQ